MQRGPLSAGEEPAVLGPVSPGLQTPVARVLASLVLYCKSSCRFRILLLDMSVPTS